jgi:methyl-accepting chemotaxis protein
VSRFFTFGRRIAAGFAIALLLLAVVATVAYRSTGLVAQASGWVSHTHVVLARLSDLDDVLTDAESASRGYVITGDDSFVEEFRKAEQQVPTILADLHRLMAESPNQAQRLDALTDAAGERLAFAREAVDLRRTEGVEAARRRLASGEGKRLMDRVSALIADMDRDEEALLHRRDAAADAAVRSARATILGGALLALVIVTAAGVWITRSLTTRIGSAVQHLTTSATELQTSASQQAATAKEQATSTTEISATVKELLATSRQIAESTQRVARFAEQAGGAATSGEGTLRAAHEGMATIRRQVDVIVAHMVDLGKKAQQIGGVLEIINELAEQTNILAINATIEAAGAAAEGRRFAAIAEEIRRLADRTGVSTKEIRALVDEIRAAANTTVMATEQGAKATDAGTRQFGDMTETFKQISGLVLETSDSSREIELSTRQQATAVEQVSAAMLEVSRSAGEVETTSRQTVQVAAQLAELAGDLARLVRAPAEQRA